MAESGTIEVRIQPVLMAWEPMSLLKGIVRADDLLRAEITDLRAQVEGLKHDARKQSHE